MTASITVSVQALQEQMAAIYRGWGMAEEAIARTVEIMLEADVMGIDSHGVTMFPTYETLQKDGRLTMNPQVRVVKETPVMAVIDGDGGLGHYPSSIAMDMAIEKAKKVGMAAVTVRHSNHYGAAGVYALRAARHGLIGISTSSVWNPSVVPTRSAEPMFGTNPFAFAAPTKRNEPFLFDMATSTVAIGKLKLAWLAGKPVPEGWALDAAGQPVTDAEVAMNSRMLTPLGGTSLMGSHKGYGLGAMVEVLSTMLAGATYAPLRPAEQKHFDIGHFFFALDPHCFREKDGFEDDLDAMIDRLHAATPVDPAQPVLVPGDPEHQRRAQRETEGVPIAGPMVEMLAGIAQRAGVPFTLTQLAA
ncbi:Ldh family oxidoreductase [Oceanibaculum pacificum]|uniref:Malate dehydrogenase n=1 Tax=Oceanibaculum pacificum TaxID=580166 RepID=A0A154V8N7_9PROT|nr:Ldh family oxidoreductase [Oceanibaculum pacificum]KZC97682.1 malate dehydrogenase [Oceanibaculum pacificum]